MSRSQKGSRPGSFKPQYVYVPPDTSVQKYSVYSSYYRPPEPEDWGWCRARPIRHRECIQREDAPMQATSTMQEDFHAHADTERVQPIIPKPTPLDGGQFDGNTTYEQEFKSKPISPPPPRSRPQYVAPSQKFRGETTTRESYQRYSDAHREQSFKPPTRYQPCPTKFDDATTSSSAYREWTVNKPEKPAWGLQKVYSAPTEPLDGHSSYQEEFQRPNNAERAELQKPRHNGLQLAPADDHIDPDRTLYQQEFEAYPDASPPKSFQVMRRYEAPEERMEQESAYQAEYRGRTTSRAQPCIPVQNRPQGADEHMHFNTTYRGTYSGSKLERLPIHVLPPAGKPSVHSNRSERSMQNANRSNNANILQVELPVRKIIPQYVAAGVPSDRMSRSTSMQMNGGSGDRYDKSSRSKSVDPKRFLQTQQQQRGERRDTSAPRRTSRRQPSASPPRQKGSSVPVPIRAGRARARMEPASEVSSTTDTMTHDRSERAVKFADDSVDARVDYVTTDVSTTYTTDLDYATAASSITSADGYTPTHDSNGPAYTQDPAPASQTSEPYGGDGGFHDAGSMSNASELMQPAREEIESY